MAKLSELYHINENLRGMAKDGHCRPTIAELWDSSVEYDYAWCTLRPIYTASMDMIYAENEELVMV